MNQAIRSQLADMATAGQLLAFLSTVPPEKIARSCFCALVS